MKKMNPESVLKNWTTLNAWLPKLKEAELSSLIDYEKSHDNRKSFMDRLHSRYSKLKNKREREKLLGK